MEKNRSRRRRACGYLRAGRRRYIWCGSVRTRPCYLLAGDAWRRREARRGRIWRCIGVEEGIAARRSDRGDLDRALWTGQHGRNIIHGACRACLAGGDIPIPRFRLSPAAAASSFLVSLTSTSLFYQRHDRSIVIVAVDPRRRHGAWLSFSRGKGRALLGGRGVAGVPSGVDCRFMQHDEPFLTSSFFSCQKLHVRTHP